MMCVDLQEVIKIIEDNVVYSEVIDMGDGEYDGMYCCRDLHRDVISKLQLLPSVELRKTGHWIDMFGMYRCSNCNHMEARVRNFCEDCGADMRGEE